MDRIIFLVSAAALTFLPRDVVAQQPAGPPGYGPGYGYGPSMMGWDGGWGGMIFGPLFMIIVLAGVIALAVLMVRWLSGPGYGTHPSPHPGSRALDILKERYARGEIDKAEYEERRRILGE